MKKVLFAALLCASTAAFSSQPGFFVGLGGVTGATTAKVDDFSVTRNGSSGDSSSKSGRTMLGARLEAGYGWTFKGCTYLGLSAYGTLLNTQFEVFNFLVTPGGSAGSRIVIKNNYNLGVELKLGYLFDKNTMGFVGIAGESGKYKIEYQDGRNGGATIPLRTGTSKRIYAKPVIGMRRMLSSKMYVEMKYGYGFGAKVSLKVPAAANGVMTATASGGRNVSAKINTHELSLTLGWKL